MFKKIEYKYIVVIVYAAVLFLDRLDLTIVNITLPTLANDYQVPITKTEWVVTSFLLALALVIPTAGWLGDRFGVKKTFTAAIIIFGLFSLFCGFAPNLPALILFRFIQGIGGGLLVPAGVALVYAAFEPTEYASITSFIFLPTLIAPGIAPLIGGILVDSVGWQWVFLLAVPICAIAAIISCIVIQEPLPTRKLPFDRLGFVLSSFALLLLFYVISILGAQGFSGLVCGLLFGTFLLFVLFMIHERRSAHPLLDLKFFRQPLFVQANLIQLMFQICHFGSFFLIGMYLQTAVGMSAIQAGLVLGMQAFGAMCASRYSVFLFNRHGPKLPLISGLLGVAIFSVSILLITSPDQIFLGLILLFVRGLFSGLCGAPLQTMSLLEFKKNEISHSGAVFNMGRQLAISLGVALSSLLIASGFRIYHLDPNQFLSTKIPYKVFYFSFFLIPITVMLGVLVSLKIDNQRVFALIKRHKPV